MQKILFLVACLVMSLLVAVGAALAFAPEPHEHVYTSATTDPTCEAEGVTTFTCNCGDSYIETTPALGHVEEDVAAKDATCTEAGLTAGKKCTVCDKMTVKQESIPALGHDAVIDTAVSPTCTETGLTGGSHCTRCDYKVEQEVIPALGHDMVIDAAVEPNCNDTGLTEGSHCSRCDYKIEQDVIPALGHDVKIIASLKPTCTETGLRQGYYCARCDGYNIKQDVVPATGHSYDDIYDEICNVCGHVRIAACRHMNQADYGEAKDATCTESGLTLGVICKDCDEILKPQQIIEKLGHSVVYHDAKEATCTELGWGAYETCERCDYTTYAEIAALGHDMKTDVAVAPTCLGTGLTEGSHCSRCDYKIAQETVPATGHTWTSCEMTTVPSHESVGLISGTCANCANPTYEMPTVSVENGYTAVFTGVISRWEYTFNGQTFTFDITENTETTDYLFGLESFHIGKNDAGSMIFKSGYKYANATQPKYGCCFMDGNGKTFTTTVVVPERTCVTLLIQAAGDSASHTYDTVFGSLTINGDAAAVLNTTSEKITYTGWHVHTYYEIATVILEEGTNVIQFTSKIKTNVAGIGFKATKEVHMHTDVIDPAIAATCTTEGKSEGLHCSTCNAVITAQETIPALGHTDNWTHTMTTKPTYTTEGLIESVNTCKVCGIEIGTNSFTVPVVDKDAEGYEVLVSGVASRYQYTYEGAKFIIDLMESGVSAETYSFGTEAWYVDRNGTDTPIGVEGFKYTNAGWHSTNLCFKDSDRTYTTTIVVDKPTAVTLIINCARNKAKPFYSTTGAEHVLDWIKVNNSDDNVIYDMDAQLSYTGWTSFHDYAVATLFLEEGANVISFNTSTTTNFKGIGFISTEEIKLAEDNLTLDLMSFNIRTDADSGVKSWAQRKGALINSIITRNPSVVTFQEVKKNQYQDLAAGLTEYTVVWYARQGGDNPEGLAIAYKTSEWNEVSRQRFWLSETPDVQSKGWGESYYRILVNVLLQHKATGQHLNVFSVHLGLVAAAQVNGMQLILDEAAKYDYPTFIAGDFNCTDQSETYANTSAMFRDTQKYASITESGDTFQSWGSGLSDGKDYIIDFCFVSKEHFAALEFDICQDKWGDNDANFLSDHFALITKVALLVPHTHDEVIDEAVAATCSTDGLTEGKHCTSCGKVLVAQDIIYATGEHVYATEQENVAETCTTDGYIIMACGCGATETTVIPAHHVASAAVNENVVDPTLENAGSIDLVVYCSVCEEEISRNAKILSKLSLDDYTTYSSRSADVNPTVTTTFTLISSEITYAVSLTSSDILYVNRGNGDIPVTKYDYQKLNTDIATITYVEGKGYFYDVVDGVTETGFAGIGIRSYGAMLTITGNVELVLTARWGHNYGLTVGTADNPGNVYLKVTTTDVYGLCMWDGSDLTVNVGSVLKVENVSKDTIRCEANGSNIYVAGTLISNGTINKKTGNITVTSTGSLNVTLAGKGLYLNSALTLTVDGTMNVGYVTFKNSSSTFKVGATGRCYITGSSSKTPTITAGGYAKINGTEYGTPPSSEE